MEASRSQYIWVWIAASSAVFIINYGLSLLLRIVMRTYASNAYDLQILSAMLSIIVSSFVVYFVVIAIYNNFPLLNYEKVVSWLWPTYFIGGAITFVRVLVLLNFDAALVAVFSGFLLTAFVCQKLEQMEHIKDAAL